MTALETWRIEKDLSYTELGELIEATHVSAARYCRKERIPQGRRMRRIVQVTEGAVQPNDFYDIPELEAHGQSSEA